MLLDKATWHLVKAPELWKEVTLCGRKKKKEAEGVLQIFNVEIIQKGSPQNQKQIQGWYVLNPPKAKSCVTGTVYPIWYAVTSLPALTYRLVLVSPYTPWSLTPCDSVNCLPYYLYCFKVTIPKYCVMVSKWLFCSMKPDLWKIHRKVKQVTWRHFGMQHFLLVRCLVGSRDWSPSCNSR